MRTEDTLKSLEKFIKNKENMAKELENKGIEANRRFENL